jgi:hypothetical protein
LPDPGSCLNHKTLAREQYSKRAMKIHALPPTIAIFFNTALPTGWN